MKPLDLLYVRPTAFDIDIEMTQCRDEGKDTTSLEEQAEKLKGLNLAEDSNILLVEKFYDAAAKLPTVSGYQYQEPSDLESIQLLRNCAGNISVCKLDEEQLFEQVYGAWLGRIAGCMLGKPVEGVKDYSKIKKYLEAQGRWPLSDYFSIQADDILRENCGLNYDWKNCSIEGITCGVEDDDTNYTTTGFAIYKSYGPDFTQSDVALFWLLNIPVLHTYTAERVAYRNLLNLITPPISGSYRNPYREWIGAQIRADFWGYICPGDSTRAAEYAWRDASISHVKNGIYGEMWVAAMLAAAYTTDDIETVIRAGLSEIPSTSRLYQSIELVISQYHKGLSYEDAVADLRSKWDESSQHDWCHTISNAMIVAIALLWGAGDFTKTLGYAVMAGFDTDCNGATAGSVLGLMLGASALPNNWIEPLQDTLQTGVAGYYSVKISDLARETVAMMSI